MTLLYGEADASQRASLEQHLAGCEQCRSSVAAFKGTMGELSTWKLPRKRQRQRTPVAAWAAAAAILALAAVGGARLWTLEAQVRELRAEVARTAGDSSIASLREELRQVAAENEKARASDRDAFAGALQRAQATAAANYATLRKELETVAILTEAGFQSTQSEIAQLASDARDNSSTQ